MRDPSVHHRVVGRLIDQVYDQPLIGNLERGMYVQYMIEWALKQRDRSWEGTVGWAGWDLEHTESRARIEVKQSSKLQTWLVSTAQPAPRFSIKPTNGYYAKDSVTWVETGPRRQADIYIFAYHPENDRNVADHRRPDQWEFYLVPERELPPSQKSIGLNQVQSLGPPGRFETLAREVTRVIKTLPRLKAENSPL